MFKLELSFTHHLGKSSKQSLLTVAMSYNDDMLTETVDFHTTVKCMELNG